MLNSILLQQETRKQHFVAIDPALFITITIVSDPISSYIANYPIETHTIELLSVAVLNPPHPHIGTLTADPWPIDISQI